MNLSASASSSAKGGEFSAGAGSFNEGDWNVSTAGDNGISTKTIFILAAVGIGALWLKHKKTS